MQNLSKSEVQKLLSEKRHATYIEFTTEQLQKLAQLYVEDKKSTLDLAKIYGVSKDVVRRRLLELGVTMRESKKVPKIPDEAFHPILQRRLNKESWERIGHTYNVHHSTVMRWFKDKLDKLPDSSVNQ